MARTLNSPVAEARAEFVYLYEINHSGGVVRLTNAPADLVALTYTWIAVGGSLIHGTAPDLPDSKAQGITLNLYGVDQTITAVIQNNQFRGRIVKVYLVHFNPDTGAAYTPDLVFRGRQNGDYQISEDRSGDSTESGGSVTVTTRITSDLSAIKSKQSCRCNVHSHEEYLRRSGVGSPDDKFFERVPTIMDKAIYWGTGPPEVYVPIPRPRPPEGPPENN